MSDCPIKLCIKKKKTAINNVFARFPVSIKEGVTDKIDDVLDAMEQFLIDELKSPQNNPAERAANLRNQIDVDNPARSKAKEILEKIKLCK